MRTRSGQGLAEGDAGIGEGGTGGGVGGEEHGMGLDYLAARAVKKMIVEFMRSLILLPFHYALSAQHPQERSLPIHALFPEKEEVPTGAFHHKRTCLKRTTSLFLKDVETTFHLTLKCCI